MLCFTKDLLSKTWFKYLSRSREISAWFRQLMYLPPNKHRVNLTQKEAYYYWSSASNDEKSEARLRINLTSIQPSVETFVARKIEVEACKLKKMLAHLQLKGGPKIGAKRFLKFLFMDGHWLRFLTFLLFFL